MRRDAELQKRLGDRHAQRTFLKPRQIRRFYRLQKLQHTQSDAFVHERFREAEVDLIPQIIQQPLIGERRDEKRHRSAAFFHGLNRLEHHDAVAVFQQQIHQENIHLARLYCGNDRVAVAVGRKQLDLFQVRKCRR